MTATSAQSLRQRRLWSRSRETYSVRVFFSSILVVCALAAVVLAVSGERHAGTGAIPVGRTIHRRGIEALNKSLRDEEVYSPDPKYNRTTV